MTNGADGADSLELLLTRMNHLEELLVSSLFAFILTATFTVFAGVYTVRKDADARLRVGAAAWVAAVLFTTTF